MPLWFLFAQWSLAIHSLVVNNQSDFGFQIYPSEKVSQILGFPWAEIWPTLLVSSHRRRCTKGAQLYRELIKISGRDLWGHEGSVLWVTTNLPHLRHLVGERHLAGIVASSGCQGALTLYHPAFVGRNSYNWTDSAARNRSNGLVHSAVLSVVRQAVMSTSLKFEPAIESHYRRYCHVQCLPKPNRSHTVRLSWTGYFLAASAKHQNSVRTQFGGLFEDDLLLAYSQVAAWRL